MIADYDYNVMREIDGVRELLRDYYHNKSFNIYSRKNYGEIAKGVMRYIEEEEYTYRDMYVYRLWYAIKCLLTTDIIDYAWSDIVLQYMNNHRGALFIRCLGTTDKMIEIPVITKQGLACNPSFNKCVKRAFYNIQSMIEYLSDYVIPDRDHVSYLPDSLYDEIGADCDEEIMDE